MAVEYIDEKEANTILSKIKARFEARCEKSKTQHRPLEEVRPPKGKKVYTFYYHWYPEYHSPVKQLQGHKNVLIAREQEQEDW